MPHRHRIRPAATWSVAACATAVGICLLGWKFGWLPVNAGRAAQALAPRHAPDTGPSAATASAEQSHRAPAVGPPTNITPLVDVSLATELRRALAARRSEPPREARFAPRTHPSPPRHSGNSSAAAAAPRMPTSAPSAPPLPVLARPMPSAVAPVAAGDPSAVPSLAPPQPLRHGNLATASTVQTAADTTTPSPAQADPRSLDPAAERPTQPQKAEPPQARATNDAVPRAKASRQPQPPANRSSRAVDDASAPPRTARIPDRSPEPANRLQDQDRQLPATSLETPAALADIDRMIERGDDLRALRELSKIYWQQPQRRAQIQKRLDSLAQRVFFAPQPHYLPPYVVRPGDVLERIARKYAVTWQYLARLNRIDPKRIRPGQKLKVVRGPFAAFVDLSDFELTVHLKGYYVKRYTVGIGKDGASPIGRFVVRKKVENPQYTTPEGKVIPADDPANPVGEYWIDIGDGYGLHGTIDPQSVGRAESRGCIRLRNEDIAEVFTLLVVGSEVVIRP